MAILKMGNVILRENDESKIKELEAIGYKKVTEADLKRKKKAAPKKEEPKAEETKAEEPKKEAAAKKEEPKKEEPKKDKK